MSEQNKILIHTGFRFSQKSYPAGDKPVDVSRTVAEYAIGAGLAEPFREAPKNKAAKPGSKKEKKA